MKGILLSACALVCYIAVSIPFLRMYRGQKPYRVLQASMGIAILFYSALFYLSPPDLGFLSEGRLETNSGMDFFNGILILILLYNPYLALFYGTTFNGFSTQLMVFLKQFGPLGSQELVGLFYPSGQKQGQQDPMTSWRLTGLARGGYIESAGDGYRLRPKGRIIAWLALWMKRIIAGGSAGG